MKQSFLRTILGIVLVVGGAGCERKLGRPTPDTVTVTLESPAVSADEAATQASAFVTEKRIPLQGITVSFQVTLTADSGANPSYAALTAVTDVNGRAAVPLSGLSIAGSGAVTATAMREQGDGTFVPYLDAEELPIAGSASLEILPGAPASVVTALSSSQIDPDVENFFDVSFVVRDAQGNRTDDLVTIETDHPNATILGNRVADLSAAGAWMVSVSVAGRPDIADSESFIVGAGAAKIIDVTLSKYTTDAYAQPDAVPSVVVAHTVRDGHGNVIAAPAGTGCTISASSGAAINGVTLAVDPLVVKGTFPVTCSFMDGATLVADTETLTVIDLRPPVTTITEPVNDTHFAINTDFTVSVRGQDVVAVSELTAQLVGLGVNATQSQLLGSLAKDATVSFTFTTPGPTDFGGTMTLFGLGADGSGNLSNASAVTIVVAPFDELATGAKASLVFEDVAVAFGEPRAIAADPTSAAASPRFQIGDRTAGAGTIWTLSCSGTPLACTRSTFATALGNVRGVEWDATGSFLWASVGSCARKFNPAGTEVMACGSASCPGSLGCFLISPPAFPGDAGNPATVEHLVFGDAPFLYVADSGNDHVRRINTATNTVQATPFSSDPLLVNPTGLEYDAAMNRFFVSDLGVNDRVLELKSDANADGISDGATVFMAPGFPALGPDPDAPWGLEFNEAAGLVSPRLLVGNVGVTKSVYRAQRDVAAPAGLSDGWDVLATSTSTGRQPRDLAIHPGNGRLYILYDPGAGLEAHVVEFTGF